MAHIFIAVSEYYFSERAFVGYTEQIKYSRDRM